MEYQSDCYFWLIISVQAKADNNTYEKKYVFKSTYMLLPFYIAPAVEYCVLHIRYLTDTLMLICYTIHFAIL